MIAHNLRLDVGRVHFNTLRQMHPKAQAIEESAGAKHAFMLGACAGDIGQRIGWVRDNQDYGLRRRAHYPWHEVAVDIGILG
jgi:hypothetical protein